MRLKFWGVRGSTPTPERRNSGYGGNSPCVEVRLNNGTILIFDCGSGMRPLGKSLLREFGDSPIVAYVFLSHFHWDHIQGIPFFLPLYRKGNAFFFHSAATKGLELEHAMEEQMATPYFPVDMTIMGAVRHFYDIGEGPIDVNGAVISSAPLNHPQGCIGYRIEADGGVLTYATDTEPGSEIHDQNVRKLAKGADVFIYDCQYTPEQLTGPKKGWGHSTWVEGVKIAQEVGARQFVLFHHEPEHDDAFVGKLVSLARKKFPNSIGATEGHILHIPDKKGHAAPRPRRRKAARAKRRSRR